MRGLVRLAVIVVVAASLAWLASGLVLRTIGAFLVTEDSLERGAAILVLGGASPFREMEGARLYRDGWAPRVILVAGGRNRARERAWRDLGVDYPDPMSLRVAALTRLGVPVDAITVAPGPSDATLDEIEYAVAALPAGGAPLIAVTSAAHTRRTGLYARATSGRRVIVRIARQDPFPADGWWREQRSIWIVVREYLGLANWVLGFPIAHHATAAGAAQTTGPPPV